MLLVKYEPLNRKVLSGSTAGLRSGRSSALRLCKVRREDQYPSLMQCTNLITPRRALSRKKKNKKEKRKENHPHTPSDRKRTMRATANFLANFPHPTLIRGRACACESTGFPHGRGDRLSNCMNHGTNRFSLSLSLSLRTKFGSEIPSYNRQSIAPGA
ncbi:hypothetical protein BJX64DRAFT_167 [Aspergillus heterothallicus]